MQIISKTNFGLKFLFYNTIDSQQLTQAVKYNNQ